MANVIVYIDGFNLYYGATKGTPYRWLNLRQLCTNMLPNDKIIQIKYFTAKVNARPHDPQQPMRQQIYFRALRTLPNFTIIYGHFLTHSCRMALTGTNPAKKVWVDKTEEKGSDVNIATHLLMDGFKKHYEVAVLVTNDSDLAEPVRMVRCELGLGVGILNPHQQHSQQLKSLATFIKRIRQSDLIAAQFPTTLNDTTGAFTKPAIW
jgi:uncharacterized LabA/DUF88 family protein